MIRCTMPDDHNDTEERFKRTSSDTDKGIYPEAPVEAPNGWELSLIVAAITLCLGGAAIVLYEWLLD